MESFTRADWFGFLSLLQPAPGEGSTPIALNRAGVVSEVSVVNVPIDWWVHVGGPLRKALDLELQNALLQASELCFQLKMKPDPVLTFEIESWFVGVLRPTLIERKSPLRLTFSSLPNEKRTWSEEVSVFSEIPWKPLSEAPTATPEGRAEFWLKPLGLLEISPSLNLFETFISEMVGASVDSGEPPWIFWSRFPAWWAHWDRRNPSKPKSVSMTGQNDSDLKSTALFDLDARLTFQRCALSPQDESLEEASLESGEVMLNPTFETVERPKTSRPANLPLIAFSRSKGFVHQRAITSLEALIVDGVRESFRIQEAGLIGQVQLEGRIESEFIKKAIHGLVQAGIILRG